MIRLPDGRTVDEVLADGPPLPATPSELLAALAVDPLGPPPSPNCRLGVIDVDWSGNSMTYGWACDSDTDG